MNTGGNAAILLNFIEMELHLHELYLRKLKHITIHLKVCLIVRANPNELICFVIIM
jgi:hypothetical protein